MMKYFRELVHTSSSRYYLRSPMIIVRRLALLLVENVLEVRTTRFPRT